MIDIVREAGDDGFETLVRALAKNDQQQLAKQLDETLAEKYITKPSPEAGALSPYLSSILLYLLRRHH